MDRTASHDEASPPDAPPVARQSSLVILNSVLGAAQGFVGLFAVSRYMGDDVLGGRGLALALVILVGIIARLGLPTTHVRNLARGHGIAAANGAFLRLKLALTAVFAVVSLGAAWVWFGALGHGVSDTTPGALWAAFWVVIVQSLRDVPVNSFQGLRRIREREAVLFTNTTVTILLTALVAVAYADSHGRWSPVPELGSLASSMLGIHAPMSIEHGIDLLMWAFLAGEIAALLVAVAFFVRLRIPVGRPDPGMMRSYLAFTAPLMLLSVGEVITKRLALVLLWFWWDRADIGHFAAASTLSELLLLLGAGIGIVLLPAVSAHHARRDDAGAHFLVREAERWTSLLSWPVIAVVAAIPVPFLHIALSDQFAPAAPAVVLLFVQALVACLVMPLQAFAIATGHPKGAARVVAITVVADLAFGAALIPKSLFGLPAAGLGITGAALGSLLSTLLALVLYAAPTTAWRAHSAFHPRMLKHVAAAALAFAAARVLPTPERVVTLAAFSLVVLAVYAVALVVLGELRRGDWHSIRALVRPQTAKSP